MTSILPHGGTLVQCAAQGEERKKLLRDSEKLPALRTTVELFRIWI